jgi:hypothetical protein
MLLLEGRDFAIMTQLQLEPCVARDCVLCCCKFELMLRYELLSGSLPGCLLHCCTYSLQLLLKLRSCRFSGLDSDLFHFALVLCTVSLLQFSLELCGRSSPSLALFTLVLVTLLLLSYSIFQFTLKLFDVTLKLSLSHRPAARNVE